MSEQLTVEEKATAQGWNPDYSGANAKSAEQFIADGEKIAPIQKERNNKLINDIARLEKKLDGFHAMHIKTVLDTKQESYDKAVSDLKKQQLEAVDEADTAKFEKVQAKIDGLKKPEAPVEVATDIPEVSVEFKDWASENDWYMGDGSESKEMTAYADMLGDKIMNDHDNSPAGRKRFFKAIETGVKKVFPDSFGGQSSNVPDVETPSNASPQKKGKGYKALPKEVKAAADKCFSEHGHDKEEYAKEYWRIA